ncbi:MAG: choice-of-anchor D domain-containing protein, partial [Prosthecobacter sp.]
ATLTFASNDSDEASFEVQLTGEGLIQPEIEVDTSVAANVQSHETTYDFGTGSVGAGIARTFTIRNTGNAALSSLNVTVDGANSSDFVVTTQPAASIADGSSGTFVVTFTPSAGGTRSARLQIANNDSDENPFNINLSGTGIAAPEIEVADGATNLVSGNLPFINFGNVNTGTTLTKTITIRNVGNTLLHSISVTFFGTGSPTFQTSTVVVSIPAGQQTTFDLSFSPSVVGAYSTTMRIASNDSDENPFSTVVLGTGTVVSNSEIVVESPAGSSLTDAASTLDFSTVNTGATGTKTVVIRNTGTANLTSLALSFVGTNAAEFTASALSTTTLTTTAPSDSTGFTLTFTPTGSGTRTATMRIASNDGDENPFDITLTGTGHVPAGPVFTVQPQSQLVLLGQSANFTPTVTGDPVITYKWKKGTAFITNATASSYGIAITKAADAGAYSVIADNPVGAEVPSSPAYLGLVTLSQGTQILKAGTTLSLKCTVAAPTAPGVTLSYSWRRSGDPLSNETQADGSVVTGADKAALSITKLTTADAGNYTCLVTLNTPGNDPSTANGDTVVRVVDAVPDVDDLPPDSVSVSEPIDMTITATNFPTIFSATGLPAGMTFDTKTGLLKGKPTTPSKRNAGNTAYIPSKISFKATNPSGTSVAEDFYLTIEPLVPGVVGTFNGIVERSNHSNFGMGGHVKITVASTGVVSGDVTLAGQKHTIVGSINVSLGNNPTFDLIVKRAPATLGDLRLTGGISPPDNLLQGDISDPRFEMLTGTQDLGDRNEPGLINGTMEEARFNHPSGLALLANGSGYISDSGDHVIRFVDGDGGTVSTFAGNINSGSNNGTGTAASFAGPEGLALDIAGNLFVADTLNSTIRKITPAGVVTTFAGTAGQVGNVNGTGAAARFDRPCALCFDSTGNLYVADRGNHTIRKITQSGVVTTLAGKAGQSGHKDGSGTSALFDTPRGIVYEPVLKALFVTDSANVVIRKITLTGATTTYAGSPGAGGIADGLFANARFIDPRGITTLGDGTLIVTDTLLVQLNPNGTLGTVSDFLDTVGKLDHPVAVAYNPADESLITVDDVFHGAISYEPSGVNHEAHFAAQRNPWTTTNFVPPAEQGLYNAALETTALPMDGSFPQGDGYAQVAISKSGVATWTGKAADGTSFTFSTFIAGDRSIPLHAMMYKNTGSLQGECFLNATTLDLVSDVGPAFDWYKIPQPLASTDRSYKGGFLVHPLELSGGKYTPNNIYSFLGLTGAPANLTMDLSEAGLTSFTVPFTIATPNTVTVPANSSTATLKIDPKTGIYTGSFKSGSPAVTSSFTGVIIDYEAGNAKRGYGHFLLPASTAATAPLTSGRVRLEK